ncbi:MAG: hydrolase [Tepidiforma sp.]|nr:carbon-nitrogen hydrolase family protein [Tepidiforma sp.]GIW17985.1 MAG: hydrolase [Tepidiforma sp.]
MQPFRVGLCQVPAHPLERAEENWAAIVEALDEAGRQGAQLVGLPECSYPAYYVRDERPYDRPGVRPFAEVTATLAAKCRQWGYWLAAGLAVPHADGSLTNSGLVFDPTGEIRGRYDKSFLWHFDARWFRRGQAFPVWDAGFARFGILICADARQPEVARALAANGAEVILDLTAWVSWGRTMAELSTTQCEYLVPVRAFENGVWIAAADKFGPEGTSLVYAGRSSVYDPAGVTRFCAPADSGAVVTFDIEPMAVERPRRRPGLYGRLVEPTAGLPVMQALAEPVVPAQLSRRVAAAPSWPAWDADGLLALYLDQREQDADLIVAGGVPAPAGWEAVLPRLEAAVRERGGGLLFGAREDGTRPRDLAVLITPGGTVVHTASHGRGIETGESLPPVVETPAGRVGILCGEEGFVPEVARILMLEGAEVLAWTAFAEEPMTERIARARSDENRVYTVVAGPETAIVTAPNGAPLTIAPYGSGLAMAAQVNPAMARWKDMAPGTNALLDRIPGAYGDLVRE